MKKYKRWMILSLLICIVGGYVYATQAKEKETIKYDGVCAEIVNYANAQEYLQSMESVASDEDAELYCDKTTGNIAFVNKEDGSIWFSAPYEIGSSNISATWKERIASPVELTYVDSQMKEYTLYSHTDCAAYGQLTSQKTEQGIRFTMTLGKMVSSGVLPEMLPESRLPWLEERLETSEYDYLVRMYREVKADGDDETTIKEEYPGLAKQKIYRLRNNIQPAVSEKITGIFASVDYDYELLQEDEKAIYGTVQSTEAGNATFTLELEYRLENGDLIATVPTGSIVGGSEEYTLTDLTVLKYFGAGTIADNGFILLPDGSGAVSEYEAGVMRDGTVYESELYGDDTIYRYNPAKQSAEAVRVPVIGHHKNSSAVLIMAEEGSAQCAVRSVCDEGETGMRYAHYVCHVRPSETYVHSEYASLDEYVRYTEQGYKDNYTLRVRMIGDSSYSQMASEYRKYLQEQGVLQDRIEEEKISVMLTTLGAVDADYNGLFSDSKQYLLTDYQTSGAMAMELREQGVQNISLRLLGWANSGLDYENFNRIRLIKILGGEDGYQELCDAMETENISLYSEINLSEVLKDRAFDGFTLSRDGAHQLDHTYARTYPYNFGSSLADYEYPRYIVNSSSVTKSADKIVRRFAYHAGFSIAGLAQNLRSDASSETQSRSDSLKDYLESMEILSKDRASLFVGGNSYCWPYADALIDLPAESSNYRSVGYTVPFLQMVLHGYLPYYGESINLSSNPKKAVLKAIENGEGLSYTVVGENALYLSLSNHTQYMSVDYASVKEDLLEDYQVVSSILDGTYRLAITEHTYLNDNVVQVTYEDGTTIVVNYSETAYTDGEKNVAPMSAAKVR